MSRHTLTFFFLRSQFLLSQAAPVAILPSALFVSDIRSVQGGCSRFSRCCYLISVLSSHLCGGTWAPGLSRSHLDSAVELGGPDRNSKPLPASPSDYCAMVRTPLRPPTTDVTGVFCTSGSEREFTLEGSWYADEE